MAERYIAYKKKTSEEWDKKQNNDKENVFVKSDGDCESESDGACLTAAIGHIL
jgi:hypothetical protein